MITIKNLCYDYPGKRALDHISLEIPEHSITALVGPNGAGKTTLMRCLAGLDTWTSGDITIAGYSVEHHPRVIHDMSEYLSDVFGLYDDLTVAQSLQFIAATRKLKQEDMKAACEDTAALLGLTEQYHKKARDLSRGFRQRLAIAQTLVVRPKLLILDEPASGLDPKARHELSQLFIKLQQEGITLLISSHILSELQDYSTHMMMLQDGKLLKQCKLDSPELKQENYKLVLDQESAACLAYLQQQGVTILQHDKQTIWLQLPEKLSSQALLKQLINQDYIVSSFAKDTQSLQDIYLHLQENNGEE